VCVCVCVCVLTVFLPSRLYLSLSTHPLTHSPSLPLSLPPSIPLSSQPTESESMLTAMGFQLADVREALKRANYNMNDAVNELLSKTPATPPVVATFPSRRESDSSSTSETTLADTATTGWVPEGRGGVGEGEARD
jgi:hypothetical protein